MTGIDKITFTLPRYDPDEYHDWGEGAEETFPGLQLHALLERAARRRNLTPCVRSIRNEWGYFAGFEEMPGFLVKHYGPRDEANPYVSRIEVNPSHFASFAEFQSFMDDLNHSVRWIDHAQITRIDFAADYDGEMPDICYGLDFPLRRLLSFYVTIRNGRRQSITVGSHPDVVIVYQRHYQRYFNGVLQTEDSTSPVVRIERQLRTAGKIRDILGDPLTYDGMRDQLSSLVSAGFQFFGSGVELGEVQLVDRRQRSRLFRDRQMQFEALARHNTFFEARKYLNRNNNFHRDYQYLYRRTVLPPQSQPSGVLAEELGPFLTRRGRRRRAG